jgi:hypothetical protein
MIDQQSDTALGMSGKRKCAQFGKRMANLCKSSLLGFVAKSMEIGSCETAACHLSKLKTRTSFSVKKK